METKNLESLYDLAELSIKGQKFSDAEKFYEQILQQEPSYKAWCGLGASKMDRLTKKNQSTVEEIMFCFEKAKKNDSSKTEEIEDFLLKYSIAKVKELCNLELKIKTDRIGGIVTKVFSIGEKGPSPLLKKIDSLKSAISENENPNKIFTQKEVGDLRIKFESAIEHFITANISSFEEYKKERQREIDRITVGGKDFVKVDAESFAGKFIGSSKLSFLEDSTAEQKEINAPKENVDQKDTNKIHSNSIKKEPKPFLETNVGVIVMLILFLALWFVLTDKI